MNAIDWIDSGRSAVPDITGQNRFILLSLTIVTLVLYCLPLVTRPYRFHNQMATALLRPIPRYAYTRHEDNEPDSYSAFSSRPDSPLNLGAESPGSILKPALTPAASSLSLSSMFGNESSLRQWSKISGTVQDATVVPTRNRLWRSASFQRKKAEARKGNTTPLTVHDCGIW